jgi:NH3-dependent NAD+ synthetase
MVADENAMLLRRLDEFSLSQDVLVLSGKVDSACVLGFNKPSFGLPRFESQQIFGLHLVGKTEII